MSGTVEAYTPEPNLDGVDRYQRVQVGWRMRDAFPDREDGTCVCGCGQEITGRRRRWASDKCAGTAYRLYAIRSGYSSPIRAALHERDGGICAECGVDARQRWEGKWPNRELVGVGWEADHIIPVVEGGGGCGLDNFRTLCIPCHKKATARLAARRANGSDPAQQDLLSPNSETEPEETDDGI